MLSSPGRRLCWRSTLQLPVSRTGGFLQAKAMTSVPGGVCMHPVDCDDDSRRSSSCCCCVL